VTSGGASAPTSAGILMWRRLPAGPQVLLGHFGGPYWSRKDNGAWGIPKGVIEPGESAEEAARREFEEEMGTAPRGPLVAMKEIRQSGGKRVLPFAVEGDFDPAALVSNSFELEWPPRSGRVQDFPEIDRADWFDLAEAEEKILHSQRPLLKALAELIEGG
jgi:predicted NUDIX family NTP pyrophosphohydrolase